MAIGVLDILGTSDPYPGYRALREAAPVTRSELGSWFLTRHADVSRLLRSPATSVVSDDAERRERFERVVGRPPREARSMLDLDPPDHTRLRRLVQQAFTPKVVAGLRPLVQGLVDDALDRVAERGRMDVIADLAFPLPFAVISTMLGMPDSDAGQLRDWSHTMTKALDPVLSDEELAAATRAQDAMADHLAEVIAAKRAAPADDLLTALIRAEEGGDVLSDDELRAQVSLLFIAGHETTVNLIGNGVLALLCDRRQLERLVADPSLDATAADELLRFDSPVQLSIRVPLEDLVVDGTTLPAGELVVVCLGAANRDPARFGPTADDLDLGRTDAAQHTSFGGGAHHCLGAALARLEGSVAVSTLVRRFPGIELATDAPAWNGRIVLRGLDELPVTLA